MDGKSFLPLINIEIKKNTLACFESSAFLSLPKFAVLVIKLVGGVCKVYQRR